MIDLSWKNNNYGDYLYNWWLELGSPRYIAILSPGPSIRLFNNENYDAVIGVNTAANYFTPNILSCFNEWNIKNLDDNIIDDWMPILAPKEEYDLMLKKHNLSPYLHYNINSLNISAKALDLHDLTINSWTCAVLFVASLGWFLNIPLEIDNCGNDMRDSSDWNGRVSRINSRNRCTENFAKSLNTFRKIRKKAKERNIIIRRITC